MPRQVLQVKAAVAAVVLGGAFLVLIVWAWVFWPKAQVEMTLAAENRTVTKEVILSREVDSPDFAKFVLPAQMIEETYTENSRISREGGEARDDFARGVVTLFNDQDEEQPLLPKTHLKHKGTGAFFLTDKAVRLPVQGSLEVPVTAKEQGAIGNVAAGQFAVDKLPISLQEFVYGESSQAFSGGRVFDKELTPEEIDKAKKDSFKQAEEKVKSKLTQAGGGAALDESLVKVNKISEKVSVAPGSRATEFTVATEVEARAFIVNNSDLLSLTVLGLKSELGDSEELTKYNPETFSVELLSADFETGTARVLVNLTGEVASKTSSRIFAKQEIYGLTAAEAKELYEGLPEVAHANVKLSPFWVRNVPARENAVEINIATN